jgi:hypothetical protein
MPYCPNPDCPHRLSLRELAEYNKGVTVCADCGSKLSETVPHFAPIHKEETNNPYGLDVPGMWRY